MRSLYNVAVVIGAGLLVDLAGCAVGPEKSSQVVSPGQKTESSNLYHLDGGLPEFNREDALRYAMLRKGLGKGQFSGSLSPLHAEALRSQINEIYRDGVVDAKEKESLDSIGRIMEQREEFVSLSRELEHLQVENLRAFD